MRGVLSPRALAWLRPLAGAALLCASSCGRLALEVRDRLEIEVELPERPQRWAALGPFGYRIIVPPSLQDPGATLELPPADERSTGGSGGARGGSPSSARLVIPKRMNLPLLAYPIPAGFTRADLLRPAGAVFPYSISAGGRLRLRYEDGFLASLLLAVSGQGELLSAVNVPRLRAEILEKCGGDPWSLDPSAILETLVYATMRSSRIRPLDTYSFELAVREGEWVWGDPFRPGVATREGLLPVEGLPAGSHALFRVLPEGGAGDRLLLVVDERGWGFLDALTGGAESGRW